MHVFLARLSNSYRSLDRTFSSPSAAASVIHGGHANGLIAWNNTKGFALKELEQKEMANNPMDSEEE